MTTPLTLAGIAAPLDDSQQHFCSVDDGAIRLLAPAGSGKTHALLWRCRALAERSGLTKPRFLVFTFTRAARDELRDRLRTSENFGVIKPLVTVATLNSWGWRLVRSSTRNPRLHTRDADRRRLIENDLQPVWSGHSEVKKILEDRRRKYQAARDLMDRIDFLKSMGFRHDAIKDCDDFRAQIDYLVGCGMSPHLNDFFGQLAEMEIIDRELDAVTEAYAKFVPFWIESCHHLRNSATFTLDDQKYWARIELDKQLREGQFTSGAGRYHHIMVDEFQDINPLDLDLLKSVAKVNKAKLTIVGDDDQAIYEWRGASADFILDPDLHLEEPYQTCVLSTNYRSPKNIVDLSQKLIVNNVRRVPKQISAHLDTEAKVEVRRVKSIPDAIESTLGLITALRNDPNCSSIALIGRKRSQIVPYQIVLAGRNIPFYAAEDLHVLLSDAFNELKAILAVRATMNVPDSIASNPAQDLLKLCDKVKRYPLSGSDRRSLQRYMHGKSPATLHEAVYVLSDYTGPLKGKNTGGRMSWDFLERIMPLVNSDTVSEAIQAISQNFDGLQKDYGKSLDDIFYTDPPFLYLSDYASRYGDDFNDFYRDIEKAVATLALTPTDTEEETEDDEAEWKLPLHLMTALRAKGKEFDAVIVLDANDGVWPSKLAETNAQHEQERRLFYVAMTRARRYLYFVVNDSILGEPYLPSRFLAEMGL